MAKLQPVRGTHDLLPETARRHRYVSETARTVAGRFGYEQMDTPIFEFADVFARTLGETSDIVTKEMYTFTDKGGDRITLRPEGTAGIVRALLSGGLQQHLPLKYFYDGPMFRYERPQKGRLRQFHQVGVELLGVAEASGDVEVIAMGATVLDVLGVADQSVLHLNTLGDAQSRQSYRTALVDYLSDHRDALSDDSLTRLSVNPLRILDSKNDGDRSVIIRAPRIAEYLTPESSDFFVRVCDGLKTLDIDYTLDDRLVRGLDYYCHTAFEFITDALGAQGTVLAGGRYDGLVEIMGGPPTPGVGWAAGIERLSMMLADAPGQARPVAIVPVGEVAQDQAWRLAHRLRCDGLSVDIAHGGTMRRRMKRADKINACAAILLGEDELARDAATVRDLDSGEQVEVPLGDLTEHLSVYR